MTLTGEMAIAEALNRCAKALTGISRAIEQHNSIFEKGQQESLQIVKRQTEELLKKLEEI